jgi:membrane glycosyltransferase
MINLLGGTILAWCIVAVLLAIELALTLSARPKDRWSATSIRMGLSAAAMLGAGILLFASNRFGVWISPVLFLLILSEEIIGRMEFYTALNDKPL